jgi:hypothetical protein
MKEHNFLSVEYGRTGFLINKAQFYSSCYLEKGTKVNSPIPYLNGIFSYGDEKILVFDIHEALRQLFSIEAGGKAELLLIVELSKFSDSVRNIFTRMKGGKKTLSRDLIGLRIKSDARMTAVDIENLRLLPSSVRGFLNRYGILACTFSKESGIHYLIEVDKICKTFVDAALQQQKGR